jgi:hypothetical protein
MRTPIVALLAALAAGGAIGWQLDRWHADYHQTEDQRRLICAQPRSAEAIHTNCGE